MKTFDREVGTESGDSNKLSQNEGESKQKMRNELGRVQFLKAW